MGHGTPQYRAPYKAGLALPTEVLHNHEEFVFCYRECCTWIGFGILLPDYGWQ